MAGKVRVLLWIGPVVPDAALGAADGTGWGGCAVAVGFDATSAGTGLIVGGCGPFAAGLGLSAVGLNAGGVGASGGRFLALKKMSGQAMVIES
jgi:hypothetical protein